MIDPDTRAEYQDYIDISDLGVEEDDSVSFGIVGGTVLVEMLLILNS